MINELVQRLSEGTHEVILEDRNDSYEDIKRRIEDGYVHITFTQTNGRTELGINIDSDNTNVTSVDFDQKDGVLHIEGTTNLNYNLVRCVADIDLSTKKGDGYLVVLEEEKI